MDEPPVIFIVGTNYAAKLEEKINAWYTTHHVPMVLSGPALGNERYQRIGDDLTYPKYLAMYEYASHKVLAGYLRSQLHTKIFEDRRRTWPKKGDYTAVWLVGYKRIAKIGSQDRSLAFKMLGVNRPKNTKPKEFDDWHTNVNLVSMLRSPNVIRAEGYRRIGADASYPEYLAVCRYEDERGLEDDSDSFITRLATAERLMRWPAEVWDERWSARYKLISRERKDWIVRWGAK